MGGGLYLKLVLALGRAPKHIASPSVIEERYLRLGFSRRDCLRQLSNASLPAP